MSKWLHELNWNTLRIGWRVIVTEKRNFPTRRVRRVWEYNRTDVSTLHHPKEVREEWSVH